MHPLPAVLCCLSLWLVHPSSMEWKGRGIFPADDIEPPEVVLLSPADGETISPSEYIPEGDKPSTPAKGVVVTASVSMRGGPPRSLRQARLLVNGEVRSVLDSPPQSFTFVWNPADGYPSGPVTLQVEVEDETGARGASRQIIVRIVEGSILCPAGSDSFLCGSSPIGLLPFLAIVTVLIVIGLLVVCRKGEAGAEGETGTALDDTAKTLRFGERVETARAALTDLEGNAEIGRDVVELFGTTYIGAAGRPGRKPGQPPALHGSRRGRRFFPARRAERQRDLSERPSPGPDGTQPAQGRRRDRSGAAGTRRGAVAV
jgi:hypothetical protein